MLTEQAVDKLQQGAAIAQANAAMAQPFAALPSDFSLHDLEKFAPNRRRARGTFKTPFVAAFCAYLTKHAEAGATAFVDPQRMAATAVLNLGHPGQPGHADNLAVLEPNKTAAFAALSLIANGGGQSQRGVAEFLEDWTGHATCFNDDGEIPAGKAIAAVRRITIDSLRKQESQEQALSATRSALESVSASSSEPLPTTIYFRCQPYAELSERTFVLRLSVLTSDKAPLLVLRVVKPEAHAEQMSQELAALINAGLADKAGITTMAGTYARG